MTQNRFPKSQPAVLLAKSNLCRRFGRKPQHKIDFRRRDLRFLQGKPLHVDVCCRNPIYVDVSSQNLNTDSIFRTATCGFAREIQSMSTFRAETSTRNRFAPARPAVLMSNSILCRRFLAKSHLCRGLPSAILVNPGGITDGVRRERSHPERAITSAGGNANRDAAPGGCAARRPKVGAGRMALRLHGTRSQRRAGPHSKTGLQQGGGLQGD